MKLFLLTLSLIVAISSIFFNRESIRETLLNQLHIFTTNSSGTIPSSRTIHLPRFISPSFFASKTANMTTPRPIQKVFLAREQAEGAGARVRRSIGTENLKNFSPFLMLDHFSIKPGAGFPDHPHRGQETQATTLRPFPPINCTHKTNPPPSITYLLQGGVDHEDFAGNAGTIEAGDLQFMTAGKGIMHAEMPRQNPDGSANVGMQLWVDLPEKLKKCEPRYRDLRAKEIPKIDIDDGKVHVKVISGKSHGVDSVQELAYTPVWIFDIEIKPGGKIEQEVPVGWNAFAYTLSGKTLFGSGEGKRKVDQYFNVVFKQEGHVVNAEVEESAKESARFSKYFLSLDLLLSLVLFAHSLLRLDLPTPCNLTLLSRLKYNSISFRKTGGHLSGCLLQKKSCLYSQKKPKDYAKYTNTNATVLVAGQPLDQKVVQYGPFVLNSEEEVYQAMMDFQTKTNGFERAKGWRSEIGKTMVG
ncbi:Pirin protein [Rutstroemia sp. NJR-2017a WRK4]|nr:Pirin protein [Rutstroemia sp. NJR-2017a WRK4]